ncbi:MAG: hypothetical protein H6Q68_3039 [Firmicutes bacterium]|nr:hypothetical protein [Bacillota bacterium]
MKEKNKGVKLSRYWPFWGLHFGIHIIIGLVAIIAGLMVIFTVNEVINGLALVGAGSFAIINGWQGFKELAEPKVDKRYIKSKGNNW